MGGVSVIDRFLEVFASYIDSGFGLLGGDVAFLATTLIVIDITLAALFWAWGADDDIIARLVKKTLFVGVFAYVIGNWNTLARIVFDSFAGLGLVATGGTLSAAELLQPGRIAQVGLEAGQPILASTAELTGFVAVFENLIQILILFFAWLVVLLSFFILAIQLFVTLIEFKLATLAGFILVPFGLFNKTAFMAERVLGLVISSGVKVLVLAVIVGIGSTIFSEFTAGFAGEPTINDAMSVVLDALALLALGIFGPGIANGIVSVGRSLAQVPPSVPVSPWAGLRSPVRPGLGWPLATLVPDCVVPAQPAAEPPPPINLAPRRAARHSASPSAAWRRSAEPVPSPRSARSGARSWTALGPAPAPPMPPPAVDLQGAPCPPRPMTARPTGRAG